MIKFLTGESIVDAIEKSLSETERADFAVAYWGKGATQRLGLDKAHKPVRILCDLTSLACNPNELQTLLDRGFKLKTKDGLHAKIYITSSKVIIGSANASINGLGQEGDETDLKLEAAIMTSDESTMAKASEWFEDHWSKAALVERQMPVHVEAAYKDAVDNIIFLNKQQEGGDELRPACIRGYFRNLG